MKKKKILLGAVCVLVLLAAAAVVLFQNNLHLRIGTYLQADNGSSLVILDDSPVVMEQCGRKEAMFTGLQTGDRILIVHDGIDASFPGATGVYFLLKLPGGSESDIPEKLVSQLQELGWLQGPS